MQIEENNIEQKKNSNQQEQNKENGFLNLLINIIIPSAILMKLSKPEYLGQELALVIALIFPIGYGIWDYFDKKKINFVSALGLISIFLTGGIGLMKLSRNWMIVKEAAIPAIIGLFVLFSGKTKYPLVRTFFKQIFDLEKIDEEFAKAGKSDLFEKKLSLAGVWLSITFFISSILNYILADRILVGEPGSVEFNESLGEMTALSFPVISIPMVIILGFIFYHLISVIKDNTGLGLEDIVKDQS